MDDIQLFAYFIEKHLNITIDKIKLKPPPKIILVYAIIG